MIDPDQLVSGEAKCPCLTDQLLTDVHGQRLVTGENPQVIAIRAGDKRPSIVLLIKRYHMIAAVERAEERHFERCGAAVADEQGATDGLLPRLALHVIAPVDHLDATVALQLVGGIDVAHAALERMVEPGDFVPLPEVTIDLE
jgi:hypothetical protein